MVKIVKNSMGDSECYYGESTWEEIEVTCDECGDELDEYGELYECEGKWICLDCLREKFNAKTFNEFLKEEQEKHEP